jgi:hypothetical protein
MTLTDKLERMTKLVTVMAEDEEARAAYMALRREIEPDVAPLLDLVRKACIFTETGWEHVAIIDDINDVVSELLPDSKMYVTSVSVIGFIVKWRHSCGATVCELCYGDGARFLSVKAPCCKTMALAMNAIAVEYDLELRTHVEDDGDEDFEDDDNGEEGDACLSH